jgi:hypothetical protein
MSKSNQRHFLRSLMKLSMQNNIHGTHAIVASGVRCPLYISEGAYAPNVIKAAAKNALNPCFVFGHIQHSVPIPKTNKWTMKKIFVAVVMGKTYQIHASG